MTTTTCQLAGCSERGEDHVDHQYIDAILAKVHGQPGAVYVYALASDNRFFPTPRSSSAFSHAARIRTAKPSLTWSRPSSCAPSCTPRWVHQAASSRMSTSTSDSMQAFYDEMRAKLGPTLPLIECTSWCEDQDGHPNNWSIEDQTCWSPGRYVNPSLRRRSRRASRSQRGLWRAETMKTRWCTCTCVISRFIPKADPTSSMTRCT